VSLRWRIAALMLSLLVGFALVLAYSITAVVDSTLEDYQRGLLEADARRLQDLYSSSNTGSPSTDSRGGVRVTIYRNGKFFAGEDLFQVPAEEIARAKEGNRFWRPQGGSPWLALLVPMGLFQKTPNAVLMVTADISYIQTLAGRIQTTVFITSLALIGLALAGGYLSAQLGLRPLVRVAAQARSLNERNLEPLRYSGPRDELGVLVEALNRLVARLKRAFEAQTVFLAEAAHELRTPLTAIEGYLRRAARDPSSAPEAISDAQRVTGSMTRLVSDLLQLSRGEVVQEFIPHILDWRDTLRAVVGEFPGVQLKLPEEPLEVLGDPDRLTQLIRNLTGNAVRAATHPGGVKLEARVDGDWCELTVSDDGIGIGEEVMPRLFEKFVKGKGGGSGLGLAIAAQVVSAHGGQIRAENIPGSGARFTVRIPKLEDEG
jgi:two-component system, OmpR family, sensor kinase